MRTDKKLYEAAGLRGYLHCFRLVLGVQKLYEAVITSLSFHNAFEIGLMKRVRYLVEVLGVRYFAEGLGLCLRSSTFDGQVARKSCCPKSCCPKLESCCPKFFVMSPKIMVMSPEISVTRF